MSDHTLTLLDLLKILRADPEAKIYPYHAAFDYEKITGTKESIDRVMPAVTQQKLAALAIELSAAAGKGALDKVAEIQREMVRINREMRDQSAKFVPTDGVSRQVGYPIRNLVYHEDRANISLAIRVDGRVELPKIGRPDGLPNSLPAYQYTRYTIIRDGEAHTDHLPVSMGEATFDLLKTHGLLPNRHWQPDVKYALSITGVPVSSPEHAQAISAAQLFRDSVALLSYKADLRVFNYFYRTQGYSKGDYAGTGVTEYGKEQADWLQFYVGLQGAGLYRPPYAKREYDGEDYLYHELHVGIKGFSELPSVPSVEAKLLRQAQNDASVNITPREQMLVGPIQQVMSFMKSDTYVQSRGREKLLKSFLEIEIAETDALREALSDRVAVAKYHILANRTEFRDYPLVVTTPKMVPIKHEGRIYQVFADIRAFMMTQDGPTPVAHDPLTWGKKIEALAHCAP